MQSLLARLRGRSFWFIMISHPILFCKMKRASRKETDEDRHILSSQVSKCDYTGDGLIVAMTARHDITKRLFAALQCEMLFSFQ